MFSAGERTAGAASRHHPKRHRVCSSALPSAGILACGSSGGGQFRIVAVGLFQLTSHMKRCVSTNRGQPGFTGEGHHAKPARANGEDAGKPGLIGLSPLHLAIGGSVLGHAQQQGHADGSAYLWLASTSGPPRAAPMPYHLLGGGASLRQRGQVTIHSRRAVPRAAAGRRLPDSLKILAGPFDAAGIVFAGQIDSDGRDQKTNSRGDQHDE